jgi:hypothetical protein
MRKIILIFLILTSFTFAQSENQIGWIAKFGAAGGFTPMIMFPNIDGINQELNAIGMDQLSSPIVTWGGGGYAYVMIIDNLRLGGIGFSGSQSEVAKIKNLDTETEYSLGGGALTIEYTFPFVKNMALSAGFMIGAGSLDIDIYQNENSFDWSNIWDEVKNGTSVDHKELSIKNSFYFISPTVNIDFPITRFLALRGGIGYQFTFSNDWEIGNEKTLNSVPNNIDANGFVIQTGILIGLFAF